MSVDARLPHLVQLVLLAGEGEGEPQRKFLVFYAQLIQEVGKTLRNVVEELK